MQQTSTAKLPAFFQKFLKTVRALMVNEMKIYLHFVEHVCRELCFVWACSNIVIYVEHSVLFLNPYASYCPYDYRQSEIEDIFYRWLFVLQEFSTFYPKCFVVTVLLLGYNSESFEKQIWQNDQTQYRTSKVFEGIF